MFRNHTQQLGGLRLSYLVGCTTPGCPINDFMSLTPVHYKGAAKQCSLAPASTQGPGFITRKTALITTRTVFPQDATKNHNQRELR